MFINILPQFSVDHDSYFSGEGFGFLLNNKLIIINLIIITSIEWVVKMMEDRFLSVEILEITSHMNLLASGSIPVEGSSKKTIGGFPIMAIETDSFLLFPPESVPDSTPSNLYINKL